MTASQKQSGCPWRTVHLARARAHAAWRVRSRCPRGIRTASLRAASFCLRARRARARTARTAALLRLDAAIPTSRVGALALALLARLPARRPASARLADAVERTRAAIRRGARFREWLSPFDHIEAPVPVGPRIAPCPVGARVRGRREPVESQRACREATGRRDRRRGEHEKARPTERSEAHLWSVPASALFTGSDTRTGPPREAGACRGPRCSTRRWSRRPVRSSRIRRRAEAEPRRPAVDRFRRDHCRRRRARRRRPAGRPRTDRTCRSGSWIRGISRRCCCTSRTTARTGTGST